MAIGSIVNYWNVHQTAYEFNTIEKCDGFIKDIAEVRRYEKNFFLYHEAISYKNVLYCLKNASYFLQTYKKRSSLLLELEPKIAQYRQIFVKYAEEHISLSQSHKEALQNELRKLGYELSSSSTALGSEIKKDIIKGLGFSKHIFIIFTICLIIGLGMLIFGMVQSILGPLNYIQTSTSQVIKGHFRLFSKPKHSVEEINTLIDALNKMIVELDLEKEKLIQSKKMASLGTFIAGIAHEINNPLNNIYLTAEGFLEEFGDKLTEEQENYINDILSQAERASIIVANLLDFSRSQTSRREFINLGEVINNVIKVSQNFLKINNINLEKDIPASIPLIWGNPNTLRQVFINLIENSIQAMPNGGRLGISVRAEDKCLKTLISDTGKGISPEYQSSIFEPFFTTKEKGTGLGLSVTYGIIKRHGGEIKMESEVNKGTTFTILLPLETNSSKK